MQKVQYNDIITLLFLAQNDGVNLSLVDSNLNIIDGTIDDALNTYPYKVGYQIFGSYTNPQTGSTTDLYAVMYSFKFSDFLTLKNGIYRLIFSTTHEGNTVYSVVSEYLHVQESHPFTEILTGTYNSNNPQKNLIVTGWFLDGDDGSVPYNPVFQVRVESTKVYSAVKAVNVGYLQSNYQQLQNKTLQRPYWKITLGENSLGIPPYLLETCAEIMLADNFYWATYPYIIDNPEGKTSIAELFKLKQTDVKPLMMAEIGVTERWDAQRAILGGSTLLWSDPMNSGSIAYPYAIYEFSVTDSFTSTVIPSVILKSDDDATVFLNKLNGYYSSLLYLSGTFTHVDNKWYYNPAPGESVTFGTINVLTSYVAFKQQTTVMPSTRGFQLNGTTGLVVLDWGVNAAPVSSAITGTTTFSRAESFTGVWDVTFYHNEQITEMFIGTHYIGGHSYNFIGNFPSDLKHFYWWGTTCPAIQTLILDHCTSIDTIHTRNLSITSLNRSSYGFIPLSLVSVNYYGDSLDITGITNLMNWFMGIKDDVGYFMAVDLSGGSNLAKTSWGAPNITAYNTLTNAPYFWNILHN